MKIVPTTVYEISYKGAEAIIVEDALLSMIPPFNPKSNRSSINNKYRCTFRKFGDKCPSYYFRKTVRFKTQLTQNDLKLCIDALRTYIKKHPNQSDIGYQKLLTKFKAVPK